MTAVDSQEITIAVVDVSSPPESPQRDVDKDRLKERLLNHHLDAKGASGYLDCPQPNILRSKSAENLNVQDNHRQRRNSHSHKGAKHDKHDKHDRHHKRDRHQKDNHSSSSQHGNNHLNGGSFHGNRRHSHTPHLGMLDAFSDHDPGSVSHQNSFNNLPGSHIGINMPTASDTWSRRSSGNTSIEGMVPLLRQDATQDDDEEPEAWQPGPGDQPMYDGPDLPTADLPEDHMGEEPLPKPLDLTRLPGICGYEGIGYHYDSSEAPIIPPPKVERDEPQADVDYREEEHYLSLVHINENQAREALMNLVSRHCCYGKKAAKELEVTKIIPSSALHYTLETYSEVRSTTWEQEPFNGQNLDGPSNGAAPTPWEIHCNPTQMFHDEVRFMEVPHTASCQSCHGCGALGWVRCHSCLGRGFKRCMYCHGTARIWRTDPRGHRHAETCWHCHGSGRKRCIQCNGDGRIVCKTCQGFRQLKCYIKLRIEYSVNKVEHIAEHSDMPGHLVKNVGGELVLEQTQPRVWPLTRYPDEEVCVASQRLINDQISHFAHARILMQRQRLRAVPVSEVSYFWKNKEGRFWVYGKENAVYAPKYPQRCCWGCTIL